MNNERLLRKATATIESIRDTSIKAKPLFISGPPKVGKTYEALYEADNGPYKRSLYLNFEETPQARALFDGDLSYEAILFKISSAKLTPDSFAFVQSVNFGKLSLLILDNIDLCPKAITSLKYLSECSCMRIIAISRFKMSFIKDIPSLPIGYVDSLEMGPLSFDEFLVAIGYNSFDLFKGKYSDLKEVPSEYLLQELTSDFDSYLKVGGLPEAVLGFKRGIADDFWGNGMGKLFSQVVSSFSQDKKEASVLSDIIKEGIQSSSGSNPKIKINGSNLKDHGTRNDLRKAWELGLTSSIVRVVPSLNEFNKSGFHRTDNSSNKAFAYDSGVARYLVSENKPDIEGCLYENLALLLMEYQGLSCAYPVRSRREASDFIVFLDNGRLLPVDIKTGLSCSSRSLYQLVEKENLPRGIIAARSAFSVEIRSKTIVVPILYLSFIKEIIEKNGLNK